jgi:hypothetical protein
VTGRPQTLLLHVGYGRCGSTAIQQLGAARRDELRARGLLYPRPSDLGLGARFDPGGNARALAQADDPLAVADTLADHVAASGCRVALASAEQLIGAADATLARLVARLGAHGIRAIAVLYVREQREWLISRWAHGVRQGWAMPLEQYLRDHAARGHTGPKLDYRQRCRRLAAVFGAENVVVRRFARDTLTGGDVRRDLLDIAGVDATGLLDRAGADNPSLSLAVAVALRRANAAHGDALDRRAFLRRAAAQEAASRRDLYRLARPEILREIGAHYAPLNEAFRAEFLHDVVAPVLPCALPDDYEPLTEDAVLRDARRGPRR